MKVVLTCMEASLCVSICCGPHLSSSLTQRGWHSLKSFLKFSLRPFHLALTASSANTVNIAFTLLANVHIEGTFQHEFLSDNFHSRCE